MFKNGILIFLALLTTGCANVSISPGVLGTVTDMSGNPINANIVLSHDQLENKTKSTVTDGKGHYSMSGLRTWTPIPFSKIKMQATVEVTAVGYEPYSYKVGGPKAAIQQVQLVKEQ